MLWIPWQSGKACGLLRSLRIVKETNYIEKLSNARFTPWKITSKNITMVFIWPWKPLHSRSPFFDVWCFELLIWTAGATKTEGSLLFGSDISCSQPPENCKFWAYSQSWGHGDYDAADHQRLGWVILWSALQKIDQVRDLFTSKVLPMWWRGINLIKFLIF